MHRRAIHSQTNGGVGGVGGVTTAASDGVTTKDKLPLTVNEAEHAVGAISTTTTGFAKRRRKVRSKGAFSSHYGRKFFKDDGVKCLVGIIIILVALIGAGLVIIFHLMKQNNIRMSDIHEKMPSGARGLMMKRRGQEEEPDDRKFPQLQPSKVYRIPHSMSHIGDKSDGYASQRRDFEEKNPYNPERSLQATKDLRKYDFEAMGNPSYDIYNCPDEPPVGYPYEWNTLVLLKHWSADDPNPPEKIYQGLCVFDFAKDYVKALNYRRAELPFVTRGDPEVAQAAERWNSPDYMETMLGETVMHRAEYSESNHFMYWMPSGGGRGKQHFGRDREAPAKTKQVPKDWKAPTKQMRMTYRDWVAKANVTDDLLGPDKPHWYFRLIGCGETGPEGECDSGSSEYLFDELTFFQPRPSLLYMVDYHQQKGIHCRFGMKGVIAENHFDASRNAIVVLGGERRYILSHPDQCRNLALLPKGHPSARHSAIDWSHPDLDEYSEFAEATSNEVVLQAGDVLYLPTNWFHFIISLSLNFQCNTRSGRDDQYMGAIRDCGF